MDSIILRDLSTQAKVGLDCWGRERPQPILISVTVSTDITKAGLSDKLDDLTINYSTLGKGILRHVDVGGSFESLHDLALQLAEDIIPGLRGHGEDGDVEVKIVAPKQLLCA